jgi:hypothetical protein
MGVLIKRDPYPDPRTDIQRDSGNTRTPTRGRAPVTALIRDHQNSKGIDETAAAAAIAPPADA